MVHATSGRHVLGPFKSHSGSRGTEPGRFADRVWTD